jgi:hypothetical protein
MHRRGLLVLWAGIVLSGPACQRKADVEVAAKKAAPANEPASSAPATPSTAAAQPGDPAPVGEPPPPTAEQGSESVDLGRRFADPPWFRKTMLEGAKVEKATRSKADEQGRFSSQILFELPEGTTVEACADAVTQKVAPSVKNLARKTEADGRITITGSTDRYKVTLICGETQSAMRAYVGFTWTS